MKAPFVLVLVWLLSGAGAVAGSILGHALGSLGLKVGAFVGGALASAVGAWLCVRLGWLPREGQRTAIQGAVIGFVVAVPIAVLNLHGPTIPVLACALTGVGALVGAQMAREA